MAGFPPPQTLRPAFNGGHYVASTGHYLATMASLRILEKGGNAIDAGVAGGFCINVLQPDMTNMGGVAPIMLYSAKESSVYNISGLGTWPKAANREFFLNECDGDIPYGVHRCVMPAAVDAWLTALKNFGTMSFAEVIALAIELAENGFAAFHFFRSNIEADAEELARWPSSAEIFLPNGRVPELGEIFVQKDLANMLRMLAEAEEGASSQGREAGIQAARDRFYKGDIAERIAAFHQEQGGFLTLEDLKEFSVEVEKPVRAKYRGYDVYGCDTWTQGAVAPHALAILEGYDLRSMGHNSADSIHLIIEALKAAFADREQYYGDPRFVDVPIEGILNADYAADWRDRISMNQAAPGMPDPGNPWKYMGDSRSSKARPYNPPREFSARVEPDTSYLCVVDAEGNAFSATPSDGVSGSPVIPGLGFIVSGRGKQSRLDSSHPASLEPGKRPRLTKPGPDHEGREGLRAVWYPRQRCSAASNGAVSGESD